jgi:hypothetical protein
MHDNALFVVGTISASALGDTIAKEAQNQWHSDPHNLDGLKAGLNSAVQQLPSTLSGTVQQFVNDFDSNYTALLNQRIVIGQILEKKVAPDAQELDLQIKDSFDSFQ